MGEEDQEIDELFAEAEQYDGKGEREEKAVNPYEQQRKLKKVTEEKTFNIDGFVPTTDELNMELKVYTSSTSFIAVIPSRDLSMLFGMPSSKLREMIGNRGKPGPWFRLRLNSRIRRVDQ